MIDVVSNYKFVLDFLYIFKFILAFLVANIYFCRKALAKI